MSQRNIIILVTLAVLLLGAAGAVAFNAYRFFPPGGKTVRLDLTGTIGMKVTGFYTANGVRTPYSGVLPATITAAADDFTYAIRLDGGDGNINGKLFVNGAVHGSSGTTGKSVGVKGGFESRGVIRGQGAYFTTFTEKDFP